MAKNYRVTRKRRLVNSLMKLMIRLGIASKNDYILTVKGRKSGNLYETPVTLNKEGEKRWLVAPYGEVGWVRNVRADPRITLTHGQKTEYVTVVQTSPVAAAPVLKRYLAQVRVVRPYFDVHPDSPLEAFVAEAPHHSVFEIRPRDTK